MKNRCTVISAMLLLMSAHAGAGALDDEALDAQEAAHDKTPQFKSSFGLALEAPGAPQDAFSPYPTLAEHPVLTNHFASAQLPYGQGDEADNAALSPGLLSLQGGLDIDWGQDRFALPLYHQEFRYERERALTYDALGVEWSRRLNTQNLLTLSAQYGDYAYAYADQPMGDTTNSVAAFAWSSELTGALHPRVSSSIYLGDETAKDDAYRFLGRRYYGVTLDGRFTPYPKHTPYASLRLQRSDYLAEDALLSAPRREDFSRLAAGWDWQVRPNWGLRAEANYSLNNSSVESFGYDRARVLFTTRFDFR